MTSGSIDRNLGRIKMRLRLLYLFPLLCAFSCRLGEPAETKRLQIINLSFARTGTTSFAGIFNRYRTSHEFMQSETINALMDYREGKISRKDLKDFLRRRDKIAGHSVDSATFLFLEPELIFETFPDAKYFFSLRKCDVWVVSQIGNGVKMARQVDAKEISPDLRYLDRYAKLYAKQYSWEMLKDRAKLKHVSASVTRDLGHFWSYYTINTLTAMLKLQPKNRLVIHLEDLNKSLGVLAQFAEVPINTLNEKNMHLNKDEDPGSFRKLLGNELLSGVCKHEEETVAKWIEANGKGLVR